MAQQITKVEEISFVNDIFCETKQELVQVVEIITKAGKKFSNRANMDKIPCVVYKMVVKPIFSVVETNEPQPCSTPASHFIAHNQNK